MFSCESDGYEAVVFGAFDGVTGWTNNAYINLGPVHQEVVGAHEERHLRLQKGTPWGALLMLLALGGEQERLMPLVEACRRTHESYATYLSTAHVKGGLATLDGNPLYLDHWRTAAALADTFDPSAPTVTILEYLFHLVMSPAALADASLAGDHEALMGDAPDGRLAALTTALQATDGLADAIVRSAVEGKDVDETQDRLAALLGEHALPTLSTAEQPAHATRLMEEFNGTSATHRVHVADRSRATSLTDQLDHQQYEVLKMHRAPVRLRIGPPPMHDGAEHPLTGFVMDDEQLGAHVWGVVLSRSVIERQFHLEQPPEDERYWGLLAVDRRSDPTFARLWPLPDPPATVTEKFASVGIQSVLMTTMVTLTDVYARLAFSAATPVFVLVDVPTLPFLLGLQEEDQSVRWVHAYSSGDLLVHLVVLALDGPDPMHFVIVRSAHTVRATTEWLRRASGFRHDPALATDLETHLGALVQHLAGTFWAFDATRELRR